MTTNNKKMVSVTHISTVHHAFDQRIFHRECCSLAEKGYQTHLIVRLDQRYLKKKGVHIYSLSEKTAQKKRAQIFARLKLLKRAVAISSAINSGIYHLHDPELILVGLWLKLTTKSRVIYDCHENNTAYMRQKQFIHPILRKVMEKTILIAEILAAKSFDAIITADMQVGKMYERKFGAKKITVVHNFPKLALFIPEQNSTHKKPFDVVYHGTVPRTHLETAFEIAKILKDRKLDIRWLFFGKCLDAKWAFEEMRNRELFDTIVLDAVPMPHDEVAKRVSSAKIGFIPLPDLPKFHYNIPSKLFEFMALKMPAVLSDLPPSRPFVGDGKCAVMVPPNDYEAWADAIEMLIKNHEKRTQMGIEGRRRVEDRYNWDEEFEKLHSLYQSLLT